MSFNSENECDYPQKLAVIVLMLLFLVFFNNYFPIVKKLRLTIKILSKIEVFDHFDCIFSLKPQIFDSDCFIIIAKAIQTWNVLLWGSKFIKLMHIPKIFEANLCILKIQANAI